MDQDADNRRQEREDAEIREQFATDVVLQPLDLRRFVQIDGTVVYIAVVLSQQGPAAEFELTVVPGYLTDDENALFEEWLRSARAGFQIRARDTLTAEVLAALDEPGPDGDELVPVAMVRYRLALLQSDTPQGEIVYWEALVDPPMRDTLKARRTNRWHSRSGRPAVGSFSVINGSIGWYPGGPEIKGGRSTQRRGVDLTVQAYSQAVNRYWFYGNFSDQN